MAKHDIIFDYFHGCESEQFAFYRIPKVLFTDDYFKGLSSDAKVLYGLMLDRMSLSIKHLWIDAEDKVYVIFTLEQVMQYMNCGRDKGMKILAELDTKKGIGLIERVKQGFGKPDIIYVKSFIIKEKPTTSKGVCVADQVGRKSRPVEVGETDLSRSEKPTSRGRKNRLIEVEKTDFTGSEKSTSCGRKNRLVEVEETVPINTNNNKTDFSDNNLINLSREEPEGQADRMDAMEEIRIYTDIVKSNIEYDALIRDSSIGERGYIDEIVELMVETISIKRDTILIAGAEHPYQLVKGKFLKVGFSHIQYVLECLRQNTVKVHNVRAYLLTCIYNAAATMNTYYQAEVNHDLYGGS